MNRNRVQRAGGLANTAAFIEARRMHEIVQVVSSPACFENQYNGLRLRGTLFKRANTGKSIKCVLFIHGWDGDQRDHLQSAEALARLGYTVLTFSLSGHGESEGAISKLRPEDHLRDAMAAYDFLLSTARAGSGTPVSVVGASYGGYIASLLSGQRRVRSLVLRAPAIYPDSSFTRILDRILTSPQSVDRLSRYRRRELDPDSNRALRSISEFKGSIMVVSSGDDQVIPAQVIADYVGSANGYVRQASIDKADHEMTENRWKLEFTKLLVEWFSMLGR